MRFVLLALAVCHLAACGGSSSGSTSEASGADEGVVRMLMQDQIKARLRDPSSAEFSDMHTIKTNGRVAGACGRVNSKNGFGGMSGPQRFISGGNDITVIEGDGTMDAPNFQEAWQLMCN